MVFTWAKSGRLAAGGLRCKRCGWGCGSRPLRLDCRMRRFLWVRRDAMSMQGSLPVGSGQRWKRAFGWFVGLIAVGYVVVIVLLVVFEGRLIFVPPANVPATTPAVDGLSFEDLHIPVKGNGYVHAWWIPSADPHARTILYFHGNGGVLEREANHEVPLFRQTGANLLMVDYRGYGHSSPLHASGATTAEDALAAMQYLEQTRHIASSDIVI